MSNQHWQNIMILHEIHYRAAMQQFDLRPTYLNSKSSHPTKKDRGLGHLMHGIVSQDISLTAGQK